MWWMGSLLKSSKNVRGTFLACEPEMRNEQLVLWTILAREPEMRNERLDWETFLS